MRFLVTGSKGYIGRFIEMELTMRYGTKNVMGFDESVKARWVRTWNILKGGHFDLIVHAGANSMAWYSEPDIFWSNHETTRQILEYCARRSSKLIYFSSCAALNPVNHYGWSKKTSADMILDSGIKCAVVYPYQIYGKEAGRPSGHSVPTRILRGELNNIFDPWVRDYLHIDDLIQMLMKIIDDDLLGEYDFGRGIGVSNRELFDLARLEGFPVIGPGDNDYPAGGHAEIVARSSYLVPDIEPEQDVKSYERQL